MQLMEHQKRGVEFMFDNAFGCLNGSDMGTGKTAMAIVAMCQIAPSRVLVVCPSSLKYNWKSEITKWADVDYKVHVLDGAKGKKLKTLAMAKGPFDVVVVNYESLNSIGVELANWKPEMIICDESHKIKSHKAICTKAVKEIAKRSKVEYRWIMTGTYTPNNPLDIWSQFDFIKPGYLGPNFYVFRSKYANVYTGAGFPQIRGYKNLDQLKLLVNAFTFRVTKDECLDLPDKTYQTIEVELEEKNKKIYHDMAEHMISDIGDEKVQANILLVKMLRLQQITSGFITNEEKQIRHLGEEKVDALIDLVDSLDGEKVVVWCRFNEEIRKVQEALKKSFKRRVFLLTGEVSNEDRQVAVEEFQSDKRCDDIIVSNIQVGGTGITLTKARYAVYFSRTFNYGDATQSEDRIYRIGQKRKVTYYDLVVPRSIDNYIIHNLRNKKQLNDFITGDDVRKMVRGEV